MENAFLVVGLGNPGREYQRTRHNAGFLLLEGWARDVKVSWTHDAKFEAYLADFQWSGRRLILCRPTTFMNLSGRAVVRVANYLKIPTQRMVVVVDDADLMLGRMRMKPSGSSGGHHGLDSIQQHLHTTDYVRLRLGIGRDDPGVRKITGHVLGEFSNAEWLVFEKVIDRARCQIECWLEHGIEKAMNTFNGSVATAAKD